MSDMVAAMSGMLMSDMIAAICDMVAAVSGDGRLKELVHDF